MVGLWFCCIRFTKSLFKIAFYYLVYRLWIHCKKGCLFIPNSCRSKLYCVNKIGIFGRHVQADSHIGFDEIMCTETYIHCRLFKWDYSEALPIPARPNIFVLSCWRNVLGEYSRKRPESQWETIPDQRTNLREGPALHGGSVSKWNMKEAMLSRAEVAGTMSAMGRATKVR